MFDYEVAAVLKVADSATPQLSRVLALADEVAGAFERVKVVSKDLFAGTGARPFVNQLYRMAPILNSVSRSMATMGESSVAAFDTLKAAAAEATASVGMLKTELAESSAAMRVIAGGAAAGRVGGGGSGRGGGGHGGGGGRGYHLSGYAPMGPLHARFSAGAGLGVLAALGFGAYEEAALEHTVNRVMLAAKQPLLGPNLMLNPLSQTIRNDIQAAISQTGMSARDAESAIMPLILQMGGMPLSKRVGLIPEFLKFGFVENVLKGVAPAEAVQALVGMIHMSGQYGPAAMSRMASTVAYASTISPQGLPSIERAASYVIPTAMTAGLDPNMLLLTLATAQSAGVMSSKAGTWFQAMIQSLSPKGNFASLLTSHGALQRIGALHELGLVSSRGAPTGLRLLERNDYADFIQSLASHLGKIPQEQRLGVLYQAMGSTRAARALAMLASPAFLQRLPQLRAEQMKFLGGGADLNNILKSLSAGDPLMQFRQTMQNFTNVLMDLGEVVLPPLTKVLGSIDDTLRAITGQKGKGITAADVARNAGLGAATGAYFGGLPGAAIGAGAGGVGTLAIASNAALRKQEAAAAKQGYIFDPYGASPVIVPLDAYSSTKGHPGSGFVDRIAKAVRDGFEDVTIELDGRKVGKLVSKHAAAAANGPATDTHRFDGSSSYRPAQ